MLARLVMFLCVCVECCAQQLFLPLTSQTVREGGAFSICIVIKRWFFVTWKQQKLEKCSENKVTGTISPHTQSILL